MPAGPWLIRHFGYTRKQWSKTLSEMAVCSRVPGSGGEVASLPTVLPLGWSSYICLALSPFPHTHRAMVHVLPLNATVSTWLKTEAYLIKMLGGPELDSFGFLLISLGLRLWTGLIHWATYGASWFNRICPFPWKVSALPALHEKAYP